VDVSCDTRGAGLQSPGAAFPDPLQDIPADAGSEQAAVLAGGCFWCVEAVFKEIDGVLEVTSGYAGGTAATANYDAVCSGATAHAEVVWVRFDARRTSFGQILKVFFAVAHDPTQLDRQGNDRGRQYRSAIFYGDEAQRAVAEAYIRQLDAAGVFRSKIVTRLEPLPRPITRTTPNCTRTSPTLPRSRVPRWTSCASISRSGSGRPAEPCRGLHASAAPLPCPTGGGEGTRGRNSVFARCLLLPADGVGAFLCRLLLALLRALALKQVQAHQQGFGLLAAIAGVVAEIGLDGVADDHSHGSLLLRKRS
jgi:peptide-methionine (S)-S-oxide reductase